MIVNSAEANKTVLFYKAGDIVVPAASVLYFDFKEIEQLKVTLKLTDGSFVEVTGIEAVELAMQTKPSVLEGRRLKFAKHAWVIHNIIGHPVMQLLAFFKAYNLAFRVHEKTVPKPIGSK